MNLLRRKILCSAGWSSAWVASTAMTAISNRALASQDDDFVWPGHHSALDRPVWGHRNGLQIGLAPTQGPRGLIRIYAPYLGVLYPQMINFLSLEPSVADREGRGQSELEMSGLDPGAQGLRFWASASPEHRVSSAELSPGRLLHGGAAS
jgi:hypothetical protein